MVSCRFFLAFVFLPLLSGRPIVSHSQAYALPCVIGLSTSYPLARLSLLFFPYFPFLEFCAILSYNRLSSMFDLLLCLQKLYLLSCFLGSKLESSQ